MQILPPNQTNQTIITKEVKHKSYGFKCSNFAVPQAVGNTRPTTLLYPNENRASFVIYNHHTSTNDIEIFGENGEWGQGLTISPGGSYSPPITEIYTGAIYALADPNSGSGAATVRVSETFAIGN